MKSLSTCSTLCLAALSSAAAIFLGGLAAAQDNAAGSPPTDPPAAAGAMIPAASSPPQSQPAVAAMAVDIDSLTKDSDFTIFMRPGVLEAVRIKALRKLWTTDPIYNQVSPHE